MTSVTADVRTVVLPDGRTLAFQEHGNSDDQVVLYFHGTPSCRVEWDALTRPGLAQKLGARLIAVDRPGCGLSDFQPGRKITDWPKDVANLADSLAIAQFAVLGYSGGGSYALACAAFLPDRVTSVGVASCMAPHDAPGLTDAINSDALRFMRLARERQLVHRLVVTMLRIGAAWTPSTILRSAMQALPEPDRVMLRRPEIAAGFIRMILETTRRGTAGASKDTELMVSSWLFDPSEVHKQVDLWQGEEDRNVPAEMGHYLAGRLPDCVARFMPGEGHISLAVNHFEEIVRHLLQPD